MPVGQQPGGYDAARPLLKDGRHDHGACGPVRGVALHAAQVHGGGPGCNCGGSKLQREHQAKQDKNHWSQPAVKKSLRFGTLRLTAWRVWHGT
eukprot:scaffold2058_cov69-Phaeocystis_antarctica.AAC.9